MKTQPKVTWDLTDRTQEDTSADAVVDDGEPILGASEEASGKATERTDGRAGGSETDGVPVATPSRISVIPPTRPRSDRIVLIREWEGVVDRVDDDIITARLIDPESSVETELVEFSIEQVSSDDRHLVEPGAVFYWVIGRRTSEYGAVRNFSEIRFRRLPAWTERDLKRARAGGRALVEEVFGDST